MNLQQTLSENLQQGHKACVHLHRLVRKLTSVRAFIQMRKNEVKKQLDLYIEKLSEGLLEFRSEMLVQLEAGQKEKLQLVDELKQEYETEIDTFNNLFEEAEKYTQFDKQIRSPSERKSIQKVLEALSVLLEDLPDDQEMIDLLHLQFKPSLVVDRFSPTYFGHLETSVVSHPDSNVCDKSNAEERHDCQRQTFEMLEHALATADSKMEVGPDTGDHFNTLSKSSTTTSSQPVLYVNESTQTEFLPLLDNKLQGNVLNDIININFEQIHTLNEQIQMQQNLLPCLSSSPAGVGSKDLRPSTSSNDSAVNMSCDIHSPKETIQLLAPVPDISSHLDHNLACKSLKLDDKLPEKTVSKSLKFDTETEASGAPPDRPNTGIGVISGATTDRPSVVTGVISGATPDRPSTGTGVISGATPDRPSVVTGVISGATPDRPSTITGIISGTTPDRPSTGTGVISGATPDRPSVVTGVISGATPDRPSTGTGVISGATPDRPSVVTGVISCATPDRPSTITGIISGTTPDRPSTGTGVISGTTPDRPSTITGVISGATPDRPSTVTGVISGATPDRPSTGTGVISGTTPDRPSTLTDVIFGAGKPDHIHVQGSSVSEEVDLSVKYVGEEEGNQSCFIVDSNDVCSTADQETTGYTADNKDEDCFIVEDKKIVIDLVESTDCCTSDTSRKGCSGTEEDKINCSPSHSQENALERRKVLLPLKPLRRPLRLPKLVLKPDSLNKKGEEKSNYNTTAVVLGNKRNVIENVGENNEPTDTLTQNTAGVNIKENNDKSYCHSEIENKTGDVHKCSANTDECLGMSYDEKSVFADSVIKTDKEEKDGLIFSDNGTKQVNTDKHAVKTNIYDEKEMKKSVLKLEPMSPAGDENNNARSFTFDPESVTTKQSDGDELEIKVRIKREPTEDSKQKGKANEKVAEKQVTCAGNNKTVRSKEEETLIQNQWKHITSIGYARLSTSSSSRLGALQAHWLQHPGTDLQAALLFSFNEGLHFPIEVTMDKADHIVVADTGNHLVKVFSSSGELLKVIGNDLDLRLKRPSAMVFNSNNDMFVKDDSCVHKFNSDGQFLAHLGKETLVWPYGLAMTPVGNLITLDTNPRKPVLVHLTQNCESIFSFVYGPLINAPIGTKCRFLAVSDNYVLVSDLGLSKIYITNFEGVFLGWFGQYGSRPEEFAAPSALSVDNFGNVVIGDSKNNRIKMYRQDGIFVGMIKPDDAIVRPSGLHLTKDNKLIVVNYLQHTVKVYQLCNP